MLGNLERGGGIVRWFPSATGGNQTKALLPTSLLADRVPVWEIELSYWSADSSWLQVGRQKSTRFMVGRAQKFSEIAGFLLAKDLTNRLLD